MVVLEQNLCILVQQAHMITSWGNLANKVFQLDLLNINRGVESSRGQTPAQRFRLFVNTSDLTLGTFRGMFSQNFN